MNKLILGCMAVLLMAGLQPAPAAEIRTLPPEIYRSMKSGKKLGRIWINPKFAVSQGFVIGKAECRVDQEGWNEAATYLRQAMARMEIAGSPNTLNLNIVELDITTRAETIRNETGFTMGMVGVEGLVTDPSGAPMLAFFAREKSTALESVAANRRGAIDQIALDLAKDLGDSFQRALQARTELAPKPAASPLPPPPPPPPLQGDSLDIQGRLLRLEELRKQGLITAEEYQAHKAKILSGS